MLKLKHPIGLALRAGLLATSCKAQNPVPQSNLESNLAPVNVAGKPNLIMILADDLGFSDLGCYGGEIDTPNLDQLAAGGAQFSHYRTSAMCVTTRASLLTGMEYNMAGKQLMNRGVPLARALRSGGYNTIISGKWHEAGSPTDPHMGFSNYFGFLGGATDCFNGGPDWMRDGQPFKNFDAKFYSTDALTDYAITKIDESAGKKQPFFLYLAYNAPHVPLQAPEAEVRKYLDRGTYAKGWDPIRRARTAALIKRGLVDASTPVTAPIGADVEPWDLLSPAQQKNEELKQATYAAMIDRLDQNVGKLVAELKKRGQLDNTLILFASDNGADYEGITAKPGTVPWDRSATGPRSHLTGSNGWSYANNTPFRLYKHAATEGGLASPLIAHWPHGIAVPKGTVLPQDVRLWDIYPTMLEAAGLPYNPQNEVKVRPPMGKTLSPMFANAAAPGHNGFISSYEFSRSLISGKWKLAGFEDSPWQLFDLKADRAETTDLAVKEPKILAEMVAKWDAFVADAGNVAPSWNPLVSEEPKFWLDQRKSPLIARATPKFSDPDVALDTNITLEFAGEIDFKDDKGVGMNGRIHLMKYGQNEPFWSIDPTPDNLVDARTLRLKNPKLEPNSRYYILWDANLVRVRLGNAVQPLPPMMNGPFAYRFATGGVSPQNAAISTLCSQQSKHRCERTRK